MSTLTTLEGPISALREREIQLLNDIAQALVSAGDEAEDSRRYLRDIARDLSDMFFIVAVIGEFNAGKSSFINAMVGEKLLPMGITPTTEYIELVRYADVPDRTPAVREDGIREWAHPNTGAEGVAIVDTPGTGSVFERHERTAKDFLHRSDMVLFVISAKQAFAESERAYLEMAQKYGKKVILVLNQVDTIDAGEQKQVREFVKEQVRERLEIEPLLFMVSAKQALNSDNPTEGGIDAVKAHLRGVYAEAPPAKQKLLAQLDTAERIVNTYLEESKRKSDDVSLDLGKVREVQAELDRQSLGLETRMKEAGNQIAEVLDGVRKRGNNFIDTNLSIRRIGRGVNKDKLRDEFQEIVIGRSLRDINESTGEYINAVVDQSRLYWRGVIERLNQLQDLMEQEMGGLDSGIYAEQRAGLQEAIRIAETELKSYQSGEVIADMEQVFSENMTSFMSSGLVTLVGLITALVAWLTPGPLVGAAGGVAAAPLALPAFVVGATATAIFSVPAYRYYRRVSREAKDEFNKRVDQLITKYRASLDELTARERNRLTQYGNQILTPIFSRLEVLLKRYGDQSAVLEKYQREIDDLRQRIKELS